MSSRGAPGDCGTAGNSASGGSARAGVGACERDTVCEDAAIVLACDMRQGSLESGCEDAAIVLAWDMRQGSLCTGLRDLLWFLLDIAFTNTKWHQGGQQAPEHARNHQRGETTVKTQKTKQSRQHWHH